MGLISYVKEEIHVIEGRDPAFRSPIEVLLYPGFKALLHYRLAHRLYLKERYFMARWISQHGAKKTGIEIHPALLLEKAVLLIMEMAS